MTEETPSLADRVAQDESGAATRLAAAVARNELLQRQLKDSGRAIEELERRVELLHALDGVEAGGVSWERPKKASGKRLGIANMLVSDLHLDEVVNPAEIGHVNAFNREIAEKRVRRLFDNFLEVARDLVSGYDYEGAVLPFLGDTFSGNIHEELKETNEVPILDSLDFWIDPVVAGLRMVADDMGRVHVPCTPGNHGRLTRKPIAKGRARDNFDYHFMRQVARALRDDPRVTFQIEDSSDCQMRQYGTTYHYTHGDQFRGGSGIAGLLSPMMLGDARKRKRQQAIGQPYDVLCVGHWHTYLPVPSFGFVVNGSLKGYDEYASISNFGFEPPQQAFFVTTPEHGCTFSAPILVSDRRAEGW